MERICSQCATENVPHARFCRQCGAMLETPGGGDGYVGRIIADRYRIVRMLGEGAMSRVYLAEQKMGTATRQVALKLLRLDFLSDRQLVGRFYRECETVVQLSHPNTIQFFDFGDLPDGTLYIVMEFVEGGALGDVIATEAPLPPNRVERIAIQIGSSLHDAHVRGIVHRDLKPENIVLSQRGAHRDFVKVLDFGIAKHLTDDHDRSTTLTEHGTTVGTPPYMSPEQFGAEQIDARSDVYSLGIITYQMLTGSFPFEAKTAWEWAARHTTEPPRSIDDHPLAAQIPEAMKRAVMHALQKRPEQRPPHMLAFLAELTGEQDLEAAWADATGARVSVTAATEPGVPAAELPGRGRRWLGCALAAVGTVALVGIGGLALHLAASGSGSDPVGESADAAAPLDARAPGPADAAEATEDDGDDESWFGSVHHVRNASNAQHALGPPDGAYAEIGADGILTMELAPDRQLLADGTSEPDLIVHAAEDTARYGVEVGYDHHRFRPAIQSRSTEVEIDLDSLRSGPLRRARYVRISHRGGGGKVRIDAVGARAVQHHEPDHTHEH